MNDFKPHIWTSSVGKALVKILSFDNPCKGKALFVIIKPLNTDSSNPFPYRAGKTMSDFTHRLEMSDV